MNEESKKNEIESYVILDDDIDMIREQMSNFIHIDGQVSLTDKDVFYSNKNFKQLNYEYI